MLQWVIDERQCDLCSSLIGDEAPLDLFLFRNYHRCITFDDGLASQCITSRQIIGGEPQRRASADARPVLHNHRAAATASLTTAGHIQIETSLACHFGKQCAGGYFDRLAGGLKANAMRGDNAPPWGRRY